MSRNDELLPGNVCLGRGPENPMGMKVRIRRGERADGLAGRILQEGGLWEPMSVHAEARNPRSEVVVEGTF